MGKSEGKDRLKERQKELTANIWQSATHPWVLGTAGTLVLLLYLCALFIQQMPGQLRDDPAGAARWILVMSETYGPWGGVLRTLGLFDVLHNPLLQLLVILIAFVLLVQLGNSIAAVWRLYQLEKELAQQPDNPQTDQADGQRRETTVGDPLPLRATPALFRLRLADSQSLPALSDALATYLTGRFDEVRHRARVVATEWPAVGEGNSTPTDAAPADTDGPQTHVKEEQIWALRYGRQALLRPFLFVGLLLALIAVWCILVWGWEVAPSPLAPGAEYRATANELLLQYLPAAGQTAVDGEDAQTPQTGGEEGPTLVAVVGSETLTMTIGSSERVDLGQILVASRLGPPALLMRTLTKTAMLSRLGQTQMVPSMGLVFPGPGSEESIVMNQSLGLRIVRIVGNEPIQPEQFLVEIYDARATEVVNRIAVQQATQAELTVDEMPVVVEFIPLPSLLIDVTYQPGIWLLWPALLCIVLGLVGHAYKPAFVAVQLAPWPVERTVVIAQSDVEQEIELVAQWLEEQNR